MNVVPKNKEKRKSFSQSQTSSKSIDIQPTDLNPHFNSEYQTPDESVQKDVVMHSSINQKNNYFVDDSMSIQTSDRGSEISPLSNEVFSRISQLCSKPHQDQKVSPLKK